MIGAAGQSWAKLRAMKLLMCTAMIGAALFAGTPLAHANEDPAANPPNCSAADLEFARAGVQQATAALPVRPSRREQLLQHLEGLTRDQSTPKVQAYMKTHPKTKADLTGIRQPLTDIKNRCGNPAPPPPPTP